MIHFETPWYKIETLDNYTRISHKNVWNNRPFAGVVVVPVLNDKIVLLDVFRQGTMRNELELPRGCSEPNLSPEENAICEIKEEIGANIITIISLGTCVADTAWGTGDVYFFIAKIDKIRELQKEENIQAYKLCSIKELLELINKEKIQDGFTLQAITKAIAKGFFKNVC